MKKAGLLFASLLGMGAGAFLYSYSEHHPKVITNTRNKVMDIMKDLS